MPLRLILEVPRKSRNRSRLMPRKVSELVLRTPSVSLSQTGQAPVMHALRTEKDPNALIHAQGRPTGPLPPRARYSAVCEPISVVRAAISTSPFPALKLEKGVGTGRGVAEPVGFVPVAKALPASPANTRPWRSTRNFLEATQKLALDIVGWRDSTVRRMRW